MAVLLLEACDDRFLAKARKIVFNLKYYSKAEVTYKKYG